MSGIRSSGRRGSTVVPNSRWEDPELDCFDVRIAGWLASHTDTYAAEHVTRNEIARKLNISGERVSKSLDHLSALGIVSVSVAEGGIGGTRLVITFDFDAWETPKLPDGNRSPDDQSVVVYRPVTGRQTTGTQSITMRDPEEPPPTPPSGGAVEPVVDEFDLWFWPAYPRNDGKPAARKAYERARRKVDFDVLMTGLVAWKAHWNDRGEPQFVPWAQKWLNQEQWAAEPPPLRNTPRGNAMGVLDRLGRGEFG